MTTQKQTAPTEPALRVLAVAGSLNSESVTRVVVREAARQLATLGCDGRSPGPFARAVAAL
jgi:hypothetical protein